MADEVTYALLCDVLGAVVSYYVGNGLDLPARRYVSAGVPAWDCENGQVTVRGVRRYPHTGNVLAEEPQVFMGLAQEGVQVEIEVVRCAPAFANEAGDPPVVADLNARSCVLYGDSDYVLTAVREALAAGILRGCGGVVFLNWTNAGEAGNLMGGTTTLALNQAY